jgi:hypothetical protein
MKSTVILFLLLSMLPCFARLGETVDQSKARYGDPLPGMIEQTAPNCQVMVFRKENFKLTACFFQGVCCELLIEKIQNVAGIWADEKMSDGELQGLVDENSEGNKWGPMQIDQAGEPGFPPGRSWSIDTPAAFAHYFTEVGIYSKHILLIKDMHSMYYDTAVKQAEDDKEKAEAQKTIQGL